MGLRKRITVDQELEIVRRYTEGLEAVTTLAEEFGVGRDRLRNILKRHGCHLRGPSEAGVARHAKTLEEDTVEYLPDAETVEAELEAIRRNWSRGEAYRRHSASGRVPWRVPQAKQPDNTRRGGPKSAD